MTAPLNLGLVSVGLAVVAGAVPSLPEARPAGALLIVSAAAACGSLGWMVARLRRASQRPRRDEAEAHRLDVLQMAAQDPGCALLEIHTVQWAARSGQRVWAVDTLTGAIDDWWLPGLTLASGSLVLVRQSSTRRPPEPIAYMSAAGVDAAKRHRQAALRSAYPPDLVVQAAESLLRNQER